MHTCEQFHLLGKHSSLSKRLILRLTWASLGENNLSSNGIIKISAPEMGGTRALYSKCSSGRSKGVALAGSSVDGVFAPSAEEYPFSQFSLGWQE